MNHQQSTLDGIAAMKLAEERNNTEMLNYLKRDKQKPSQPKEQITAEIGYGKPKD